MYSHLLNSTKTQHPVTHLDYYTDLLKAPRFPYQKRIHNKGHLNLAIEVLKRLSSGVFNKNLEQQKFRANERANNISLFKSNSESYGCQLRQLTRSIPSSIFLDTLCGCQLQQSTGNITSSRS